MPAYYDDNYVAGCHGTVAEQLDEAYYDDRSDADDDMEKGQVKFPKNKLYGRERELGVLGRLYSEMTTNNSCDGKEDTEAGGGQRAVSFASSNGSRLVFLSGYSGIGKSALVEEFIRRIQQEDNSAVKDSSSPVLHFSGKYTQQSGGAAPFSAISEVFGNMVSSLSEGRQWNNLSEREEKEEGVHTYNTRSLCARIWKQIQSSDVIGPDTDGNEVLIEIFPSLRPLLDGSFASNNKLQRMESFSVEGMAEKGEPSMNAVKESTSELLNVISSSLQRPLILFLDDLQWADGPSIELLLFLLANAQMKNLMFILAYRSNEVCADHPFANLMRKVTEVRGHLVAKLDLFSLSQDAISQFIADSIGVEEVGSVTELVEVIYPKTMGNIFCVMQAVEELVRKNALYYDVMCFEWRWTVDKVELANQVSADVVETIKEKIKGLSVDIQRLLAVMAFIPCSVGVSVLKELLMNDEDNSVDEKEIASLLKEASEEGMLIRSTESGHYMFAHDRIREASRGYVVEKDRNELLLHMADVLQRLGKGSKMEWCLYTAVELLNSLPPEKVDVVHLVKLNLYVSKMAKSRGSPEKENMLLRESMERLQPFKWKDYDLSLEVHNAVIASEYALGNQDRVTIAIDEVLDHAKCLRDKFSAYLHRVKSLCETKDYMTAAQEGVKVLNKYSYNIPLKPTKLHMVREKMKLRLAFKSRSYASLTNMHVTNDPVFELFCDVCKNSLFSGQPRLVMIVAWTAVRRAIEKGIDMHLPVILVIVGTLVGKKGERFLLLLL
jgi:predicted ATPase